MSQRALNAEQFGRTASQVGYEEGRSRPDFRRLSEAHKAKGGNVADAWTPHIQGQLFDPAELPSIPAHHQLPEQFAADPQTWFHARVMKEAQPKAPKGAGAEGFHAGTRLSAMQRLRFNVKRRGLKEGLVGRVFPLRATGDFEEGFQREPEPTKNPFRKGPGSIRHTGLGGAEKGYRYKNAVEDEGSISIGAPQRAGFLSTHKEMVGAAKARGEYVHPNVEWAAKHYPEHTGEVAARSEPSRYWSPPVTNEQQFWPGQGYK